MGSDVNPELMDAQSTYGRRGAVVVRQMLSSDLLGYLEGYLHLAGTIGCMSPDDEFDGSVYMYGDRGFDALLAHLAGSMQAVVQAPLLPTYSFVRVYSRGDDLPSHTDRPACEHSISLHLASSDHQQSWGLAARDASGEVLIAELSPGDALLYRGVVVPHWRDRCPVDWYAQVFLHYVDASGPFRDEQFDRRPFLGMPSEVRKP